MPFILKAVKVLLWKEVKITIGVHITNKIIIMCRFKETKTKKELLRKLE